MATFGSAGSINYPDKKALAEGLSMRSTCGSTRHSSLGDHKSLEAEALAEVRAPQKPVRPVRHPVGQGVGTTEWAIIVASVELETQPDKTVNWLLFHATS